MMHRCESEAILSNPGLTSPQGVRGFTMIEVLIAMAIFGIVSTAIYTVFISSNQSYHTQDEIVGAQQAVRVGMDFMARDLRKAGFDPSEDSGAGFQFATATKLRFTVDNDWDGVIESANEEQITYEYDGMNNRLLRTLYETDALNRDQQTLIENVTALTFSYRDANNAAIAAPVGPIDLNSIALVVITMACEADGPMGKTYTRTLHTRVRCRNR